ncbi:MAG: preprotein translocase subunit YajC [Gemmatimonadales bacterium]
MLALAFVPSDQGGGSAAGTLIMLAMFVAIFYLLLIRPQRQQQKRHQQMVQDLRRGDEVATIGGIVGKIIHIKDDRVTIKTGEDTRLVIERDKVARRFTAGTEEES